MVGWFRRSSVKQQPGLTSASVQGVISEKAAVGAPEFQAASADVRFYCTSSDASTCAVPLTPPLDRDGPPPQTLSDVQASAAQLWSSAAEEWGDGAATASSSATEPLAMHPYYVPVCILNKGASGFVQLATDARTGQRYAIKFIRRGNAFDVKTISRELMNQRMCYGHPNIIQLKEVFLTSHHLGIAMEYADGGDLSQYIDDQSQQGIDGLPEDDVRWLFQQLIVALDYCHRLGIANRDVKLDNMMLHGTWPSPVLKICDFGFSKDEAGQSVSKSTCGTPEYMAPEVLFERTYDGKAADMWSCGVSLYLMLTGLFPFARDSDDECTNVVRMQRMFTRIIQGDYAPLDQVSQEGQDLMHRLLQPDPQKRLTMDEVMDHPWFQRSLPPPLMTLNARIMATSAHNAGIAGLTQSATEVLSLVAGGREGRCMRSASASPAEYQQQLSALPSPSLPERANSQPSHELVPAVAAALQQSGGHPARPAARLGHGPLPPHPADVIRAAEALQSSELTTWETHNGYFLPPHQHPQVANGGQYDQRAWYGSHSAVHSHHHQPQQHHQGADDMDMEDASQGGRMNGRSPPLPRTPSAGRFSRMSM